MDLHAHEEKKRRTKKTSTGTTDAAKEEAAAAAVETTAAIETRDANLDKIMRGPHVCKILIPKMDACLR